MLRYFAWTAVGFLSGSVMYSYLLPKLILNKDVREKTIDGNPGAGNAYRKFGLLMGAFCLLLELLKGAVPVFFAAKNLDINNPLFALVIASPVFGHAFTPFWGFNGGKAIAVSFGALLGLLPLSGIVFILAASFLFFHTILTIKPYAFRILFTYSVFLLIAIKMKEPPVFLLGAALTSGIVCLKHKKGMIFRNLKFNFFETSIGKEKNNFKN